MSYSRPPPNVGDLISLKVDNLTDRISCRTLRRIFEKYGPIGDVYIPRDRFTQESRGFAFIRFHDKHHAEEAMDAMDGIMLDGRELRVQMARHGRLLDFHRGRSQETPRQGQELQSHSPRLPRGRRSSTRSRSPSQARSRFSRSKSPSRSCDSSPSSSRSSSPGRTKSSSESRSSSATTSRSRPRSLPPGRKYRS
ncbi:serine/arginine-rich splicing factor 2-like [Moschus berezovskii]|uniref:serine/arginine-rich splicing factor 2-like n=1 Tax=Moschus berezovskii TaxID=68408 RepID=UPI00244407F6|nr:serine/arginine-rich splicing factor 2-like [Moschus berezovskii]